MPRLRTRRRPVASHCLRFFEAYLVAYAVGLFLGVVLAIDAGASPALAAALTFAGMATAQGGIQWADRHRTRVLRSRAVAEIREMLRDRVLNSLATAELWATEDSVSLERRVAEIRSALHDVVGMIDGLTEAELDTWRLVYAASAPLLEETVDADLQLSLG